MFLWENHVKTQRDTDTQEKATCDDGGRDCREGAASHEGQDCWQSPKLTWKDVPLEPSERPWPSWHIDFGFLVSITVKQCVYILSHPTIGTLLWQPQKTNTLLLLPIVLAQSSRVIILEYKSSHVISLLKHTRMGSRLTENEVNVFAMSHKVLRDLPLWPRLLLLFYFLSLACASFETYKASSVLTVPST